MKSALLVLAMLCAPAAAAPGRSPAKPAAPSQPAASGELDAAVRMRIEAFFRLLKDGTVADAYQKLFEGSGFAKEQAELVDTLVKNTARAIEKCGPVEGGSILKITGAGKTLKEVVCILNCQKRPMRWQIYAYFGEGRWQIVETNVDLEIASFFESGKSASQ
jgi:hypothetical protein